MPTTNDDEPRANAAALREVVTDVFARRGMIVRDAGLLAESLSRPTRAGSTRTA